MLPYLLLSGVIASGDTPVADNDVFSPGLYLVQGRAKDIIKLSHRNSRCIFEIEHVYLGPASLKGKSFAATKLPGHALEPDFTIGEVGIWWVVRESNKNRIKQNKKRNRKITKGLVAAESNAPFFPFRKDVDSIREYSRFEKWAKTIERVYKATGRKRIEILKTMCFTNEEIDSCIVTDSSVRKATLFF